MTSRRQFRRQLRVAIYTPWLFAVLLFCVAATPGFFQLLVDGSGNPNRTLNLQGSNVTGLSIDGTAINPSSIGLTTPVASIYAAGGFAYNSGAGLQIGSNGISCAGSVAGGSFGELGGQFFTDGGGGVTGASLTISGRLLTDSDQIGSDGSGNWFIGESLNVYGGSNLDGGSITTNGSGSMTVGGTLQVLNGISVTGVATSDPHALNYIYQDPDTHILYISQGP